MKLFLLSASIFELVYSCARTSDSGTVVITVAVPTTTVAGVTTTVAEATTTTTVGCDSCQATAVNLMTASPNVANSLNSVGMMGPPQDGCSTLIVTCTPVAVATAFMTFNDARIGGPLEANPATATLVCNTQGEWTYTNMGTVTAVTDVYCLG